MNDNPNLISSSDLQVDASIHSHLSETARWAKFISIAGFIFSGFIVIFALYYLSLLNKVSSFGYRTSGYSSKAIATVMVYILIAIVWSITSVLQYRFAGKVQLALYDNNQEELEAAFRNLKLYYRVCGVVTIISLVVSALGLVGIMASLADT